MKMKAVAAAESSRYKIVRDHLKEKICRSEFLGESKPMRMAKPANKITNGKIASSLCSLTCQTANTLARRRIETEIIFFSTNIMLSISSRVYKPALVFSCLPEFCARACILSTAFSFLQEAVGTARFPAISTRAFHPKHLSQF